MIAGDYIEISVISANITELRNYTGLPVLAGQHGLEYLHHLPTTFLLISSCHAAAEDSTMSWGSTSPRPSC